MDRGGEIERKKRESDKTCASLKESEVERARESKRETVVGWCFYSVCVLS